MAGEVGHTESDVKANVFHKEVGPSVDASKITVAGLVNLDNISQKSGTDFVYDGDNNTITHQRLVSGPEKRVFKPFEFVKSLVRRGSHGQK
jgi:hypothetical protein